MALKFKQAEWILSYLSKQYFDCFDTFNDFSMCITTKSEKKSKRKIRYSSKSFQYTINTT